MAISSPSTFSLRVPDRAKQKRDDTNAVMPDSTHAKHNTATAIVFFLLSFCIAGILQFCGVKMWRGMVYRDGGVCAESST